MACPPTNGSLVGQLVNLGSTVGGNLGGAIAGEPGAQIGSFFGSGGPVGDAACGVFGGCEDPPTVANISMYNSIVTEALYRTILTCSDSTAAIQYQTITCSGTPAPGFSNNAGCRKCADVKGEYLERRRQLEQDALLVDSNYDVQEPNADVLAFWLSEAFIPCRYACADCAFQETEQSATINVSTQCVDQSTFNQNVRNNITVATEQALTEVTDVFGDIAQLLNSSDNCIVANISDSINASITDEALNSLKSNIVTYQEFNITGQSIWVDKLVQGINANTMQTLVQNTGVTTNVYNTSAVQASQTIIEQNADLNELVTALTTTVVSSAEITSSLMSKVMIILVSIVGAILIVTVLWSIISPSTREKIADYLSSVKPPDGSSS